MPLNLTLSQWSGDINTGFDMISEQHLFAAGFPLSDAFKSWTNRAHSPLEIGLFIVGVAGVVLMWVWIYFGDKLRPKPPGPTESDKLFEQLCQAHRLDANARTELQQLARTLSPQEPNRVFVDPQLLQQAGNAGSAADWSRRLFGSPT